MQLERGRAPSASSPSYAYFSSYSDSWLEHAERYVEAIIARFGLGPASRVVEIASNDGYLLQYFVRRGVPVLGVEPAANVARAAVAKASRRGSSSSAGAVPTALRAEGRAADLVVANNVLAHVPDLNDFVDGVRRRCWRPRAWRRSSSRTCCG